MEILPSEPPSSYGAPRASLPLTARMERTATSYVRDTDRVDLEPTRSAYERLLLRVVTETVEDVAEVVTATPASDFLARISLTSRGRPERSAVMNLHTEWLEAVFVMDPNLGVFMLDDYTDESYTADQIRLLAEVVHAFLRGEGSLETRRTFLGRHRPQLRIEVKDREWLAR